MPTTVHLALLVLAAVFVLLAALRAPSVPPAWPVHWGWLGVFFAILALLL